MNDDAKIFCVTCGEWFYEKDAGYNDGKIAECKHCTNVRDAERYRYLRSRDLDTIKKGGLFAGITPDNIVLNGIDLDQEIDTRMRREQKAIDSKDDLVTAMQN